MNTIKVSIIYKGNLRKDLMFNLEEECLLFLKKYGVVLYKDFMRMDRLDKPGAYYLVYIPERIKMGAGEDDKNLEIKQIIVDKFYSS